MATNVMRSPQTIQDAYQRRQQVRQLRRFLFFAVLVLLTNVFFWFGLMR
ncbi:MAG: hypothetical protein SGJ19_15495 [Planctomycetia bacterium]|nr:hypothetical protein [Planctomycetia bacterium]